MIWPRTKTGNECFDNSTFPKKFLKAVVKIPTTMPFEINCEGMDFTHPTISEDPHFPKGSVKDPFSLSSQDTTNRKIKREKKEEKKKSECTKQGKRPLFQADIFFSVLWFPSTIAHFLI